MTIVSCELVEISRCVDVQKLTEMLHETLSITINSVVRLAAIVKRLEELGAEVSLASPILPYIRRIAHGQILPELFVSLQGDQALLDKAATLAIPDQRRFAENKPLKVMALGGNHRMVPAQLLTRREIRQVFGRGKLRTDTEQIGWLNDDAIKKLPSAHASEVVLDKRRGGILVNGTFVSATDLAHYLSELTTRRATASAQR